MLGGTQIFRFFLVALTLFVSSVGLQAQQPAALIDRKNQVTAEEFDKSVHLQLSQLTMLSQSPQDIEKVLLQRLNDSFYVTDETIQALIQCWLSFEALHFDRKEIRPDNQIIFGQALRLIEQIKGFSYGRPSLSAYLHETAAYIYQTNQDPIKEAEELGRSSAILADFHNKNDEQWVRSQLLQANALMLCGRRAEADALYFDVLNYPWWDIRNYEGAERFVGIYIAAAKGLIATRRGDVKALKQLAFTPGTAERLNPLLQNAIEEAERDPIGIKMKARLADKIAAEKYGIKAPTGP